MTDRKLRVLHVIPSLSGKHGGPSYAVRSIARVLRSHDVDVTIATTDDDGDDARLNVRLDEGIPEDGGTVYYFRRDILPYKVSFGLARWLKSNVARFDILHVHALFSFSSTVAAHYARHKRVPYVVRPLGVLNKYGLANRRPLLKKLSMPLFEWRILQYSAAIHYTSDAEKREAGSISKEGARQRSVVIPLPVEQQKGHAAVFRQRFPQVENRRVVLFLSRIDAKKGLDLLLDAFAHVRRQLQDIILVIAGEGESRYTAEVQRRAKELQVSEHLTWTGHLEGALKAAAFAAADVFVLPSYSENFGIAAAEAIAYGVPVVVSEHVALSDEMRANEAGIVVKTEAHDIANAIYRLLTDSELAARVSANAKRLATERYSAVAVGRQLRGLYDTILSGTK